MIIYVDFDSAICHCGHVQGTRDKDCVQLDYTTALPYVRRIAQINALYDKGNEIIYWTSRGTGTNMDWMVLTYNQLEEWGCKYHQLKSGKPVYDLLIDDKSVESDMYFHDA